ARPPGNATPHPPPTAPPPAPRTTAPAQPPWYESGPSRHTPPPRPPRRARCSDRPDPHQSLDSPLGPTSGLWASSPFSFLKHPSWVTSNFGGWTFSFNLSLRERGYDASFFVPPLRNGEGVRG